MESYRIKILQEQVVYLSLAPRQGNKADPVGVPNPRQITVPHTAVCQRVPLSVLTYRLEL
jgi:hypothetical protein